MYTFLDCSRPIWLIDYYGACLMVYSAIKAKCLNTRSCKV